MTKHRNYDCPQPGFSTIEALLVVVVIIALAGGGWYIWQEQRNEAGKPAVVPVSDNKQHIKSEDDVYDGWKTFNSSAYGLEIKYPQEWTVTESFADPSISATKQEATIVVKRAEEAKYNATMSIEILDQKFEQSLIYYDKNFEHLKNKVTRTTNELKKHQSVQYIVADPESETRLYLFAVGDKTYVFASINEWLNQEYDPAYWVKFVKTFESIKITK